MDKGIQKLELHYYFENNAIHFMDAFDRNKAESHFLKVIKEITTVFDVNVEVKSECPKKGGLVEIYSFLSEVSPHLLSFIIGVGASLFANWLNQDKELKSLKKEDLKLSIEERKLKIEQLKKQLNKATDLNQIVAEATETLNADPTIKRQKSNYYKVLISNKTVSQVSFTPKDTTSSLDGKPKIIKANEFYKYILKSDDLPTIIDEAATIEIISPVLKKGNYSWRGFYNNNDIYFKLNDKSFTNDVLAKKITFSNGFTIKAVLNTKRGFNQYDNIEYKYAVTIVREYFIDNTVTQTLQGKKYNEKIDAENRQGKLF